MCSIRAPRLYMEGLRALIEGDDHVAFERLKAAVNEDSVRDEIGVLTATRIIGFGMTPDVTIGGRLQPGGITYAHFENLELQLAAGNDDLTVQNTHPFCAVTALAEGIKLTADPATNSLVIQARKEGYDALMDVYRDAVGDARRTRQARGC